ncbi:anti-sigma F factor [Desulfuribacillus stibiiarsenatis]|uniref:Anti-sigma F factor n=1 Tax=Desulfuribacillus stibiiarsenatis TaxID=1390249 RepID=A0A1E5L7I0_9FIRM|nr:anti-sigma F factor [Desulfuribacillus stibiiarsenatis]
MQLAFSSISGNESFARATVAAFAAKLDPTVEELEDIKTAVSEAVTNAIIHGYNRQSGFVYIEATIDSDGIEIIIRDEGCGIQNVDEAKEATYTSRPDLERSGMGFTIMEHLMDEMEVLSVLDKGTQIKMRKKIKKTAPTN